jgi:hypothetical protein
VLDLYHLAATRRNNLIKKGRHGESFDYKGQN